MGKSLIRVVAMLVALLTWSMATYGAGLGKLTVISTLGQPFRGEIDLVSVKKDELSSLTAKMASPDAFKQADVPYTAYVSNLKFAIEKRPNGEPYLKVSSFQPLNEPFVDFLVELSWSSGRLVRAYTALVDPPVVTDAETSKAPEVKPVPVPAPQPEPRAAAPAPEPTPEPAPAPAPEPVEAQAPLAEPAPAPLPEEPAPAAQAPAEPAIARQDSVGVAVPEPAEQAGGRALPASQRGTLAGGEVAVKSGDNLSKIARANMTEGLSLDQMLVLLYRENPDAFAGKNMNRLKTGKVLRLPDDSTVVDMSPQEARKEVRVQAANWNAYREKLAAVAAETPAVDAGAQQSSTGKVTTSVQETTPVAEAPKEVLKLSKGEPAKAGASGQDAKAMQERIRVLEEEVAAKTKASKDAGERIASLEKTIKDMQALMAIKSKGMADLQKPGAQPSVAAPAKPEPAKPEPPKAAVVEPAPATEPAAVTRAVQAPAATSGTATVTPAPSEEAPKPKKKFVPPPPPPPPGFLDSLLDNPLIPAAGAGGLVVLGGLAYYLVKRRRGGDAAAGGDKQGKKGGKKNSFKSIDDGVAEEAPADAGLGGAARGAGDFHEEGDPLAEAEIFLTYGRDNLAEERLKEAIAATPKRHELHGKLLEIYAGRKDLASFDQVAKELQIGTGGKGEIWNKAVRLGYQLDPQNARYAAGRPEEDDGTATVVVGGAGALAAATAAAAAVMSRPGGAGDAAKTNLDFNLGFDDSAIGTTTDIDLGRLGPEVEAAATTRADFDLGALEESGDMTESVILDPGTQLPGADNESTVQIAAFEGTAPLPQAQPAAAPGAGLDFDFDVSAISAPAPGEAAHEAPDDGGLNFDISGLNLDGQSDSSGAGASMAPDLDLSGINLDLGGAEGAAPSGGKDDKWFDVQTKFDLAKAYQEMGDREGAREILQEVLSEGDAEQKAAAQAVLGSLG